MRLWWVRQSQDSSNEVSWLQSLESAHRGRVCVRAFIGVSICDRLRLYCVLQKKKVGVNTSAFPSWGSSSVGHAVDADHI
jgi:hypothetical protein